jgi:hypothetical protein
VSIDQKFEYFDCESIWSVQDLAVESARNSGPIPLFLLEKAKGVIFADQV